MSTLGRTVAHEGCEWIVTNEMHPRHSDVHVYQLWSSELGLTQVYSPDRLPVITDEVRELADAKGWSIEYAARYHWGAQYWRAWSALWDRNANRRNSNRGRQNGRIRSKGRTGADRG